MMFVLYIIFNFLFAVLLFSLVLKLYWGKSYIYTQILNVYAFSLILVSLYVLEYGFYITESFNYSYLNGSATLFTVFVFIFFIILRVFIGMLSSVNSSFFNQKKLNYLEKKLLANSLLVVVVLGVLVLMLNLILSPIPLFSEHVTRINFWEYAFFPSIGVILGETSLPVVIALGVLFNFYRLKNHNSLKKIVVLSFVTYVFYLFLLGHKFSAQILAFFFFFLPFLISTNPPLSRVIKIASFFLITGVLYVLYVYSKIDSGIVSEYGGAVGGALYRIFVLQGHVFWNMFNHLNMFGDNAYENMIWLLNNSLYGLELAMHTVSPGFAQTYLESGLRFTAGFPAFLFVTPFIFAVFFVLTILFLYAFIIVRLTSLAGSGSVFRLSLYVFTLYYFHFGITMGDFRFLFSAKFLLFLSLLIFIELILLSATRNKSNYTKITSVVSK